MYASLDPALFVACQEDIWQPLPKTQGDTGEHELKLKSRREEFLEDLQLRTNAILDHKFASVIVFFMTVWALFIEDLEFGIPLPKIYDQLFAWFTLLFFLLFTVEWLARSIAQFSDYCWTFFWFMELLANLSMILSLGPIMVVQDRCPGQFNIGEMATEGGGQFAALPRLARLSRLLRVIRVIRVFASCSKQRNPQSVVSKNSQSRIGKRINEMLVSSMIKIVLALSLIFPLLSFDEVDNSRSLAFSMLALGSNLSTHDTMLKAYRTQGEQDWDSGLASALPWTLLKTVINAQHVLYVEDSFGQRVPQTGVEADECLSDPLNTFSGCPSPIDDLRCVFVDTIPAGALPDEVFLAYWDVRELKRWEAVYSICLTCLLVMVIIVMYVALSMDVTVMVVQPIESMVGLVRRLAENPTLQLEGQSKSKYETESVRIALAKIVGLMQLGFGGAGHEIISANLANSEKTGLDLMLRGKKKECAYGFCDIRQFTDTVECLQDQVMLFTNSVGEIVHQSCHDNRGEPNKNIGDAFLIVWRPRTLGDHTKIVDGALTAFRRCVREIASSQTLQLVTNVEAIHKKFGRGIIAPSSASAFTSDGPSRDPWARRQRSIARTSLRR
jgi:hypothetical protein